MVLPLGLHKAKMNSQKEKAARRAAPAARPWASIMAPSLFELLLPPEGVEESAGQVMLSPELDHLVLGSLESGQYMTPQAAERPEARRVAVSATFRLL